MSQEMHNQRELEFNRLIMTLQDIDEELRRNAAWELGGLGDEKAIEPLIGALEDDFWEVRFAAIESLGKIGNEQALHALELRFQLEPRKIFARPIKRAIHQIKQRLSST